MSNSDTIKKNQAGKRKYIVLGMWGDPMVVFAF